MREAAEVDGMAAEAHEPVGVLAPVLGCSLIESISSSLHIPCPCWLSREMLNSVLRETARH